MLFKWIGVGILMMAGGYATLAMNRIETRRLTVLDGYISLLRYIKGQINCFAMPVGDILDTADPSVLSACHGEKRHQTAEKESLSELILASRLYLEPETERLLHNFSAELGHTFREEQVMRCEDYIRALGEERRKLAEATPARIRINSILTLCTTLGMAILLW